MQSDPTSAFLREVDEALHQERLLAIWHRSKWFIMGAVLVLLLAVSGLQAFHAWQRHQDRTMAAQWYDFTQLNSDAAREKALPQLIAETHGGTRALAAYAQASLAKTPEEKAKAYAIVYNGTYPQWVKDIAKLNAALALSASNPQQAESLLQELTQADPTVTPSPAYPAALEMLTLMAMQRGDTTTATGYNQRLLHLPGLPATARQRAMVRMGALSTL